MAHYLEFKAIPDINDPTQERRFEEGMKKYGLDINYTVLKTKLKKVFDQYPGTLNNCPKIKETWEKHGPFDVASHIANESLRTDTKNSILRMGVALIPGHWNIGRYTYWGQAKKTKTKLAHGIGRLVRDYALLRMPGMRDHFNSMEKEPYFMMEGYF